MAIEYNKTNWVNNVTKLNADNMNHIENGIKNASDELNTKASVDYVDKTHYGYSGDDLLIIPEGTTTIADSAYQNANYKCVVIPDSVTSIGNRAFSACGSLTSVTIPNSVTSIGNYAFSACGSLTNITIPNGVTSIGENAFYSCSSLTGVTIGNGVTSISDYAFYGCSLTSVTIPNSVTSIGYSAFHDCPLITIDLTAYTTQSFPTIDKYNFNAIASGCQIKVIKGRKNDLIATSGWSDYASYVVEVPTVETLEAALEQDYYKIDKTQTSNTIPYWTGTNAGTLKAASDSVGNSVAQRNANGDCSFRVAKVTAIGSNTGGPEIKYMDLWKHLYGEAMYIAATSTNTGTLLIGQLNEIQEIGYYMIKYKNQLYYRYDPREAPNGTLNFIHIDSIEDGNGGYKATGKLFSVNVSTRAWKVVDLNFGGKVYQHAIHFELTGAGTSSTANVWDIELVITTSSPNKIKKNTLYKYISTSGYPLQGGTPISVYRQKVNGPQGMGIGRMSVQHEVGEISNTDHYIFELMSMDGISETITERDQNSLSSFVDTVTEV